MNNCKEGTITMRSILSIALLVSAMAAPLASAQRSTMPSPEDMKVKSTFDKFSDRLKIGYFGVLTSPHFDDMSNGHWKNAAISPEFGTEGEKLKYAGKNRDTWPTNFGAKMNFVINPRFMTPLASPTDMKDPEDRSFVELEDFLVGFQGVVASSDDSKFNLWVRPGMRLPVSRASRNSGQSGAGRLNRQLDLAYNATYDFTKTWQVGLSGQFRQWVIEDRFQFDRFRIFTAPFVQYTINDTSRIQVYYENMLETNRRSMPVDDRDPKFYDVWQNAMIGYSVDVTPKFNVMPFISAFVNDVRFDSTIKGLDDIHIENNDKAFWVGAWISYTIK
jgi:hypothetical protein